MLKVGNVENNDTDEEADVRVAAFTACMSWQGADFSPYQTVAGVIRCLLHFVASLCYVHLNAPLAAVKHAIFGQGYEVTFLLDVTCRWESRILDSSSS
jgi:hypothetical protein